MTPDLAPIDRVSRIAWAYIHYTTLAGATSPERIACTATPAVTAVLQQVAQAKASGDVGTVQAQFQALNKAYKAAYALVQAQRVDVLP